MKCPKCKTEGKVTLIDNQSLATSNTIDKAKESKYFLESEVTARAKCWHCNYEFEVRGEIEFKATQEYKPVLRSEVIATTVIEYSDFEEFVQECYGGSFEFVAVQEANNYSNYEFDVGEKNVVMADEELEAKIRKGIYPTYSMHHIFKCLYEDGYLKAGKYTIKVSW